MADGDGLEAFPALDDLRTAIADWQSWLALERRVASHTFAAFRIEAFVPESEYRKHMGAMIDGLKDSELQPGVDEILIPGELESKLEADRVGRGTIPLHPTLVQGINDACEEFGLEQRLT